MRRAAQDEWNEWLGRIEVKGGTQQQRTKFYTDLWHVLLGRHKIDDVNGEYPDLTDGQRAGSFTRDIRVKTRTLPRDAAGRVVHHMYNSDAFWLTQWNLNVLWGLGWPEMPDEMVGLAHPLCRQRRADSPGALRRRVYLHHVRMSGHATHRLGL